MNLRQTETARVATVKAGFSTATTYRIEQDPRLPSQKKTASASAKSTGRGRDSEVVPLLRTLRACDRSPFFDEIRRGILRAAPGRFSASNRDGRDQIGIDGRLQSGISERLAPE
jgi:hypothetical protein